MNATYSLEYRQTACLRCGKPLAEHRYYTLHDVMDSQGATYEVPVNGYRSPISPKVIGQWIGHEPMPWPEHTALKTCAALRAQDLEGRTA